MVKVNKLITQMNPINPIIDDDLPFMTVKYWDVPNGFRIGNINDSFLDDYVDALDLEFADKEIVGDTFVYFFNLLNRVWNKNKDIVKKYANYDHTKIHFTYDTVNSTISVSSNSGSGESHNTAKSKHIDVPLTANDETPSSKDENSNDDENSYSNEGTTTITNTLDDGDINLINKLIDNYRSVLNVLIDVFSECFLICESYKF